MLGKLKDLSLNLDGSQDIRLTVYSDASTLFDELKDKEIEVEIKKKTNRRSLDANALAWSLIDQIAAKTGVKKSEVYRNAIRDIGGVSDIVCVRNFAVEKLCKGWVSHGQGWQVEIEPSRLSGCSNVTLYYGSSVYDSRQMANLIDSLIQDAEAVGIVTPSATEREKAIEIWNRKKSKDNEEQILSKAAAQA